MPPRSVTRAEPTRAKDNDTETIATRQKKSFVRDLTFTALIVLATLVSARSVGTAAEAASTHAQIANR